MKKLPQKNPEIEALIRQKTLDLLPQDNIPNSHNAKMLAKVDALAALEYAKSQNKTVRFAPSYEDEFYRERMSTQKPKVEQEPTEGLFNTKQAAKKAGIEHGKFISNYRNGKVEGVKIGGRVFFTQDEITRFMAVRKKEFEPQ
ncbi:hypothetical protein [Chryseobacterium daeguense]|uniref:hypothetical protein n=1 Tax=Chryseobacterium daeguense TaxID=412438 RepID=UPI000488E987|nr:hypothetical protein [Chryseobacterium daeguense]